MTRDDIIAYAVLGFGLATIITLSYMTGYFVRDQACMTDGRIAAYMQDNYGN